jgi:hypothetical protein
MGRRRPVGPLADALRAMKDLFNSAGPSEHTQLPVDVKRWLRRWSEKQGKAPPMRAVKRSKA